MNAIGRSKARAAQQIICWRDTIRADRRYARYPAYAALVGIMVQGLWHFPLPHLTIDSLVMLYLNPVWRTIDTLVFTGGPILAVLLGLVGLFQSRILAKVLSVVGICLGLNILLAHHMYSNLAEAVSGLAYVLWFAVIAAPASLVYDLSGQNEALALGIWLICTIALYMLLRTVFMKRFYSQRTVNARRAQ